MKIVCLKGGLGNQMFEYCRFRDLMESGHDEVYLFYDHRRLKQHNGLRLSDCFELELPSCPWGVKLVVWGLKICRAVGVLKRLYDDEKPEAVLIDDYSQHRRFIPNARRYFFFRQFLAELQSGFVQMIRAVDYPVSETICILPTRVSVYVEWTISSKPLLMSERSGPMRVSFSFPTIWNG